MSQKTSPGYWLLKSEPDTYSIDQLEGDRSTAWNGIRNYQARNFLKEMKRGDLALFYHSGKDKAVVGLAKIRKEFYPEPLKDEPDTWVQVDVEFVEKFPSPVTLATIKASEKLNKILLATHSRLSTMSIQKPAFDEIVMLASKVTASKKKAPKK